MSSVPFEGFLPPETSKSFWQRVGNYILETTGMIAQTMHPVYPSHPVTTDQMRRDSVSYSRRDRRDIRTLNSGKPLYVPPEWNTEWPE